MLDENQKREGQRLYRVAAQDISSANEIILRALAEVLQGLPTAVQVKANFSHIVERAQARAYEIYLAEQGDVCSKALSEFLAFSSSSNGINHGQFAVLDSFFTSLFQSRKNRAGGAFETIVTTIFEKLEYPFTAQPDLGESKPDYVIPSLDYYRQFAADCIIFTCKRTLRERWRQIVTEGTSGKAFFLATIDEKVSTSELSRMKDRSVYLVVPTSIKQKRYSDAPNVITFERFLIDHLDPAINRWRTDNVI